MSDIYDFGYLLINCHEKHHQNNVLSQEKPNIASFNDAVNNTVISMSDK